MEKKLRFAPLIRVSTELQEQQGESLNTQKEKIIAAVKSLKGEIPSNCWIYSGQEHATPEFERKKFNQLLEDATKNIFDAIIVFDASRWSRDNLNSKKGLEILKVSGIRFFILTTEYDLFDPQATLFIGMSTEMNEYFAAEQARKSILSRISKAQRNIPTSGALPYGRTFDKKTNEWGIIPEKQKDIQWAAKQYLAGKGIRSLADILEMHNTTLWEILRSKCNDTWQCRFRNKRVAIDETVEITIPRLLPQTTIDAIQQRCAANKTYTHGQTKYKYLLGRLVFCEHCGRTLTGVTKKKDMVGYYRHTWVKNNPCPGPHSVRGDLLEDAVVIQLLNLAINPEIAEKAHTATLPVAEKRITLEEELKLLKRKLNTAQSKKSKIIDLIASDLFSIDDAKPNIDKIKIQEEALKQAIQKTETLLESIPDPVKIKIKSKFAQNILRRITDKMRGTEKNFVAMTWEDKRELVQSIFAGTDIDGMRAGVYIRKNTDGITEYELRGDLLNDTICGSIPMPSDQHDELLKTFKPKRDIMPDDNIDFKPERDLGPNDFIDSQENKENKDVTKIKQSRAGKS